VNAAKVRKDLSLLGSFGTRGSGYVPEFLIAQIDMSSLEISLRAESDAAVAGIHWRPLRQAKAALSEMISGLADWADSVIAFLINLPLIAVCCSPLSFCCWSRSEF